MIEREDLLTRYSGLFEHSPWVTERASRYAPFADAEALHGTLMDIVAHATPGEQLALLRAHPELATNTAPLTEASDSEQKGAGLKSLNAEEIARFAQLNAAYREKFGFPFIVCVRRHSKAEILAAFENRLQNTAEIEHGKALAEIGHITRLRLAGMTVTPKPQGLTTHVLDTVRGTGAAGMKVDLLLPRKTSVTLDAQGRATILPELTPGPCELRFHAAAYFGNIQSFYDIIPVRFHLHGGATHIHVPLILSAYGYSTYRGG